MDYDATRRALHAVAEQVVAAALWRAVGRIGLRVTEGGFGTPAFPLGGRGRQVRVEGLDLVVVDDGHQSREPLTTVTAAAAFVGIEPGAPDVYPAATPVDLDAPLPLDPAAAHAVHQWFDRTAQALARFGGPTPPPAQLWPEHFDLSVTLAEVNYGGSPGDDDHPTPYAYVGPWDRSALTENPFWNAPFGASRPQAELPTPDDVVAFFDQGRSLTQK